jgi:hypothetical protein
MKFRFVGIKEFKGPSILDLGVAAIVIALLSFLMFRSTPEPIKYSCNGSLNVYKGSRYKGVVTDKFIDVQIHGERRLSVLVNDKSYCITYGGGEGKSLYELAQINDSIYSSSDGESLILKKGDEEFVYAIYNTEGYNSYSEHK